jgi:hypothetical protein
MAGRLTLEQWRRRYGVPALDDHVPLRDDNRSDAWPFYDAFDLRTAIPAEVRLFNGKPEPGVCHVRLARVCGADQITAIVFAITTAQVAVLNTAPDGALQMFWDVLTARGLRPAVIGRVGS